MGRISINFFIFYTIFFSIGVLSGISIILPSSSFFLLIPSYLFIIITFLKNYKRISLLFARIWLIIFYIILVFCSAIWSIDPATTISEASRLVLCCLTALSITAWIGSERAMLRLGLATTLGCILSIAFIPFPSVSLGDAGDFRGLFQQKNELGFAGVIAVSVSLYSRLFRANTAASTNFMVDLISIAAGLGGILLSNSATSLVAVTACSAFMFLLWLISFGGRMIRPWMLFLCLLLVLAVGLVGELMTDQILISLGRDASFTGRTQIWEMGRMLISQRPILGYGYQVLSNEDGDLSTFIITTIGPYALQFHNSWINIQFQLGFLGILFNFVCFFYLFIISFLDKINGFCRPNAVLICVIGILFALQSVTESTFGSPRSLQTFIMIIMFIHLRTDLIEIKPIQRFRN